MNLPLIIINFFPTSSTGIEAPEAALAKAKAVAID